MLKMHFGKLSSFHIQVCHYTIHFVRLLHAMQLLHRVTQAEQQKVGKGAKNVTIYQFIKLLAAI